MYTYAKRAADFSVAIISLCLLAVPFVVVAILIKADSRGTIFFKHLRFGKDEKPFMIYKFRTMISAAPRNTATRELQDTTSYITKVGKILRKLSIDELPQLINILKGEMSVVGPRPVILAETDLIAERSKYGANALTPGITGWAQANGRDEIDIYTKARMDGDYASEFGFMMDIRCLFKTVETILFAKGYQEGAVAPTGEIYSYGSTSAAPTAALYSTTNNQ